MWKILAIFIITSSLFSCNLFSRRADISKPEITSAEDFEQGKKLFTEGKYEAAESFLVKTVAHEDENYNEAVLLLGKVYDQMSMPEKSILNLRDFIQKGGKPLDVMKAKALLMKNLAKIKVDIENAEEKKYIAHVMTAKEYNSKDAVENLSWTMDFNCQVYCVEEIQYLKEIQIQFLYAIEKDAGLYGGVFELLKSRYDFFEKFLTEQALDIGFRKKIAQGLYEALQKLKSSHLENSNAGAARTAELIKSLETYQKRIELWLYE